MVLESGLLQEREERYELTGPLPPLAIPATLHDSLMARLDRLAAVKGLAQLGATLGREFSYALLRAVAPWDEEIVAPGAAPVGGRGVPVPAGRPAAGHLHVQACADPGRGVSVVVAEHPPAVPSAHCPGVGGPVPGDRRDPARAAGPALYRGRAAPSRPWATGSGRASAPCQGSAYAEAVAHLTAGVGRADDAARDAGSASSRSWTCRWRWARRCVATQGQAAPEVARAYGRARALCAQLGDTPQLFPVLRGLMPYYQNRGELQTATQLGEQLLRLAQAQPDPALRLLAHYAAGERRVLAGRAGRGPDPPHAGPGALRPAGAPGPGGALRPGPRRGLLAAIWPGRCGPWAFLTQALPAQPGGVHPGAGGGAPL